MTSRDLAKKIHEIFCDYHDGLGGDQLCKMKLESLIRAHDDEVIESCAKIVNPICKDESKCKTMHYVNLAKKIRQLKSGGE